MHVKVGTLDEAKKVNSMIPEFDDEYIDKYFWSKVWVRKCLVLIAEEGDDLAWYLIWYEKEKDWSFYCRLVGVIPKYRSQWVSRMMFRALEEWMKQESYTTVTIKTQNKRREMLSFLIREWFMFTVVESEEEIKNNSIFLEREID